MKIPEAMCFNWFNQLILASEELEQNGARKFGIMTSCSTSDQAFLKYNIGNDNKTKWQGDKLNSIAVNKDGIMFLAAENGYI